MFVIDYSTSDIYKKVSCLWICLGCTRMSVLWLESVSRDKEEGLESLLDQHCYFASFWVPVSSIQGIILY